jgi:hypothetical protein
MIFWNEPVTITNGRTCQRCGQWVLTGHFHNCAPAAPAPAPQCDGDQHVFVWQAHTPGGSFDYAAPPGLRCQCGEVEYWVHCVGSAFAEALDKQIIGDAGGADGEMEEVAG